MLVFRVQNGVLGRASLPAFEGARVYGPFYAHCGECLVQLAANVALNLKFFERDRYWGRFRRRPLIRRSKSAKERLLGRLVRTHLRVLEIEALNWRLPGTHEKGSNAVIDHKEVVVLAGVVRRVWTLPRWLRAHFDEPWFPYRLYVEAAWPLVWSGGEEELEDLLLFGDRDQLKAVARELLEKLRLL